MTFTTIAEARAYGKAHPESAKALRELYEEIRLHLCENQPDCIGCAKNLAAAEAAEQAKQEARP